MGQGIARSAARDRPVRVRFPVRVSFSGNTFLIKEFTANLSVGGIFLPTERMVLPGSRGELTFRVSQWEEPFTVEAEVVRTVPPDAAGASPPGLGIQFLELDDADRKRLQRLIDGIQDGSVVQSIRRCIREGKRNLAQELRRRPTDQKVMLAVGARGEEIGALIRDGNPTVVLRLLDNPSLTQAHVRSILKDGRTATGFLIELKKHRRWMADEETRFLFCKHPKVALSDAIAQLRTLPAGRLRALECDTRLRAQIRAKAHELIRRRG